MALKDSCVQCVNYEFRAESLGLNHEDPRIFVQSQVSQTLVSVNWKCYMHFILSVWSQLLCLLGVFIVWNPCSLTVSVPKRLQSDASNSFKQPFTSKNLLNDDKC